MVMMYGNFRMDFCTIIATVTYCHRTLCVKLLKMLLQRSFTNILSEISKRYQFPSGKAVACTPDSHCRIVSDIMRCMQHTSLIIRLKRNVTVSKKRRYIFFVIHNTAPYSNTRLSVAGVMPFSSSKNTFIVSALLFARLSDGIIFVSIRLPSL